MKVGFILLVVLVLYTYAEKPKKRYAKNWESRLANDTRRAVRGGRGDIKFEYDMLLPLSGIRQAVKGKELDITGGNTDRDPKWKNGIIPYRISPRLQCNSIFACIWVRGAEIAIRQAIAAWEKDTCIKFVPKTDKDKDFVTFRREHRGFCASHVGRIGGEQRVYLGSYCRTRRHIMHLIGHVLGFVHEESRTDRDDYIKVNWNLIKEKNWVNYGKYKVKDLDRVASGYDQQSIMQLGYWNIGRTNIRGKMTPKKGTFTKWKKITQKDVEKTNAYYGAECAKRDVGSGVTSANAANSISFKR